MKTDRLILTLAFLMRVSTISVLLIFLILVGFISIKGVIHLSLEIFTWEYSSNNISMTPAIINTLNTVLFALTLATSLDIFGTIYLSEYGSKKSEILNIVRVASETLVGIPSIVYSLFGYLAFVLYFGFKISFVARGLTLAAMILPLILRGTEETLKSVPLNFREASFASGVGKLRTIFIIILPVAVPGILARVTLSIGHMVGESAALLYISGGVTKVAGLMDSRRTLSVHMYAISNEGQYINEAHSATMILIIIVFLVNLNSDYLAKKLVKA